MISSPIIEVTGPGHLTWGGRRFRCALGHGGRRRDKREGDGATPIGRFPLRRVFYRPDVIDAPDTRLPAQAIDPRDGWCDDPADTAYNRLVRLPYAARHEELWRDDEIYDVVVDVGYNDDPPVPGLGSAIFMHIARPDFSPTEGCVALRREDLLTVLAASGPETELLIQAPD